MGAEVYVKDVLIILCLVLSMKPAWLDTTETIQSLLRLPSGSDIVIGIALNDHLRINSIIRDVIQAMVDTKDIPDTEERESTMSEGRAVVLSLCKVSPAVACAVRNRLTTKKQLPSLVIDISIDCTRDLVSFLCW